MTDNNANMQRPAGGAYKQLFLVLLIVVSVYLQAGLRGFMPFLNVEAFLLVFGGTFLLAWTAYPLKELFSPSGPEPITYAAGCAAAMGALTTVLGLVLMLAELNDIAQIGRRMSYVFSALFFGLLLSEVILAPIAARLAAAAEPENKPGPRAAGGRRLFLTLLALGAASFGMMTLLFSLASALYPRGL